MINRIKYTMLIGVAILMVFIFGVGVARAQFGWRFISAPCNPTGVAISSNQVAVICPNEARVYLKDR